MFKVGDRVRIKGKTSVGRIEWENHTFDRIIIKWDGDDSQYGYYSSSDLEHVEEPKYAEGWTLNDGVVEAPEGAKVLTDDTGDVVAFKPRVKPVVKYLNVYKYRSDLLIGSCSDSRVDADKVANKGRVSCIKVELVEGRWDE